MYSNGFRKKLSNQNPFLANIFKVCWSKSWAKPKIGWIVNLQISEKNTGSGIQFGNRRSYSTDIIQKGSVISLNLVLWGTNIYSTVGKRFTRSELSMVNSFFINKRNIFSIPSNQQGLHPCFVTGFLDAECSFMISILKNHKYRTGWQITPLFSIELHNKDLFLLKQIQSFFGVGSIRRRKTNDQVIFSVCSVKDLTSKIIPKTAGGRLGFSRLAAPETHFDKYLLLTQKRADFELFRQVIQLMNKSEDLTSEGIKEIVRLKASINLGLTSALKEDFPDLKPALRFVIKDQIIYDPNWLIGFIEGEGCFFVDISKSKTNHLGYQVKLKFIITQHYRDYQLINSLIKYLDCGVYYSKNSQLGHFLVTKFGDINE